VSIYKTQPLNRTFALKFESEIADIHTRHSKIRGSIASKIPADKSFVDGDAVAEVLVPVVISNIERFIVISAYGNFNVAVTQGLNTINLMCTGIFVFFGAIDSINITAVPAIPPELDTPIRFAYSYS